VKRVRVELDRYARFGLHEAGIGDDEAAGDGGVADGVAAIGGDGAVCACDVPANDATAPYKRASLKRLLMT